MEMFPTRITYVTCKFCFQSYTFPGYTFPGGTDGVTILDSGTTLSMLPSPVAQAYNRAWGATWKGGVWYVDCSSSPSSTSSNSSNANGTKRKDGLKRERKDKNGKRNANPPPPFSVQIANKMFTVDARDLVVYVGTDAGSGDAQCVSGIQDGGPGGSGSVFILGDVFLHNVVATFDIQRNEVTITQRERY
ncbi:aspartic peptidase domain-containing protein [Mycena galericulata]|nr:aspartic peptidase domain-containing protein [Mycena galericulata]